MDEVSTHISNLTLWYKEDRDHIANIRKGAAMGNHLAKASLETIAVKEIKLQQMEALGKFLRGLQNASPT